MTPRGGIAVAISVVLLVLDISRFNHCPVPGHHEVKLVGRDHLENHAPEFWPLGVIVAASHVADVAVLAGFLLDFIQEPWVEVDVEELVNLAFQPRRGGT